MTVRFVKPLLCASLLALAAAPGVQAQQRSDVTLKVGIYGGATDAAVGRYLVSIYSARTGVKVEFIDGNAEDHLAKLIAAKGREAPYDVVYLDDSIQVKAAQAGVISKITEAEVPNLKFVYDEAKNKDGYGPAYDLLSCGLTYNVEKFKAAGIPAPTSWADMWDPRLAGHVGVPTLSTTMGQCFLVAAEKLAGGDESTPEKGIAKIAEIKVQSYPGSSTQITTLLESGDIWMVPWLNGRAWGMIDKGGPYAYVLPKEGGYRGLGMIDVVEGTKHRKEALAFVNQSLDPLAQLGFTAELPYGVSNKLLEPIFAAYPDIAKKFPASVADLHKLNEINWAVFNPNLSKAIALWNRQVVSK